MKDVEAARLEVEARIREIAQKYSLDEAELAWILLAEGTSYYFHDICHRRLKENGGDPVAYKPTLTTSSLTEKD